MDRLDRNLYVMLKFTEWPKTPGITLLSLIGISYLQLIFVLIWMKQTLIWFILQRYRAGNGFSNIKDTFATNVSSAPKYVDLQSLSLKLKDDWAKNFKNVPAVSYSNGNVETTCNSKLKFTELKDLFIKGCWKTSQKWTIYSYVANTATLKLRIFSERYHFRLWVFAWIGKYFCYWFWRLLPKLLQVKWCQNLRKPCTVASFYVLSLCL